MNWRVAVLGAGVAGLTAAQELAERGFRVTVFENRQVPGGKSRSMPVPGSGTGRRPDLPGEHGFRFFPGFYRHVPDTMARIPGRGGTVADHLVPAERITISRRGGGDVVMPAHLPLTPGDTMLMAQALAKAGLAVPFREILYFVERLAILLRSCDERRFREFERLSWWEFSGAAARSPAYQQLLADGLTRTLVAAKATEMSARTGGYILLQLLSDLTRVGAKIDRVLDGPTSDVWITPWVRYLTALGVDFRFDTRVDRIHCDGERITGITVGHPASTHARVKRRARRLQFDLYVAAVPVEIMVEAFVEQEPNLVKADPRLGDLANLETRWMNGVLFYFRRDVPLERGHTLYIDSPWALTSISQQQFWRDVNLLDMGNGTVGGVLSVDVSDWDSPGYDGKRARECTRDEVVAEVWRQLQDHLNDDRLPDLVDGNLVQAFVDPAIEWPNPTEAVNAEPLLINTPNSWSWRPEATTTIENFFLAGDYVRTHTDLATMEGANESARRAVNGILEATGSDAERCAVWNLREPLALGPLRAIDRVWLELAPHRSGGWAIPGVSRTRAR